MKIRTISYLTEGQDKKVKAIAAQWGCSVSAAIARLINEYKEGDK